MKNDNAARGNSSPSSVTGERLERELVALVVQFANQPPPTNPRAVEDHFWRHPYARQAGFWVRTVPASTGESDPLTRARAAEFGGVQRELQGRLADIVGVKGRTAVRKALLERLPLLLETHVAVHGLAMRMPLGRLHFSYHRGRFALEFAPFLTGVQAAIDYGLGLLLDTRRDFVRGFTRCTAPQGEGGACGQFFWRSRRNLRYCSTAHAELMRKRKTTKRQQAWRRRHPNYSETAKKQRKPLDQESKRRKPRRTVEGVGISSSRRLIKR